VLLRDNLLKNFLVFSVFNGGFSKTGFNKVLDAIF